MSSLMQGSLFCTKKNPLGQKEGEGGRKGGKEGGREGKWRVQFPFQKGRMENGC